MCVELEHLAKKLKNAAHITHSSFKHCRLYNFYVRVFLLGKIPRCKKGGGV